MATIFNHFYENKDAFLNPYDFIEKISGFPEVCITTFSESIIKKFVENNPAKVIANLYSANGKIIIPSSAVRDEGTSYHYFSGSEEISAEDSSTEIAVQCLKQHGIPYVVGKVWTTDAIYRETPEAIEKRKKQGCIAVEMECSAALAISI